MKHGKFQKKKKKSFALPIIVISLFCMLVGSVLLILYKKTSIQGVLGRKAVAVVQNDIEIFKSKNISDITAVVFRGMPEKADIKPGGIIAPLFANAQVCVIEADETGITYEIVSPDISNFFITQASAVEKIQTEKELADMILNYASSAKEKTYTVTLQYQMEGDNIFISYNDPDFVNAMTGGLIEAYISLLDQSVQEGSEE